MSDFKNSTCTPHLSAGSQKNFVRAKTDEIKNTMYVPVSETVGSGVGRERGGGGGGRGILEKEKEQENGASGIRFPRSLFSCERLPSNIKGPQRLVFTN